MAEAIRLLARLIEAECGDACLRVCGDPAVVRTVLENIHPSILAALVAGCTDLSDPRDAEWELPSASQVEVSQTCMRHLSAYVCSSEVAGCLFGEAARMGGLRLCLTSVSGTLGEQSPPWTVYDAVILNVIILVLSLIVFVGGFAFVCCNTF